VQTIRPILVIALALHLVGCATSTANYTPPNVPTVKNSKTVAKPFDSVWDALVKELSSDFFVINNIDKNSRLINISFTSQKPSDFVDCGISTRTFKNARGEQTYNYQTADSATFTTTNQQGHAFNFRRHARLEGRANIYVAPEEVGTLITVNTKYVLTVVVNGTSLDGRPTGTETHVFDPSTKQSFSNGQVTCTALGNLEKRILNLVQ
jgi:hypothetical protein